MPTCAAAAAHLPGVVRLHAADRDQRVATLRDGIGDQVFELPRLVATVRESLLQSSRLAHISAPPSDFVRRSSGCTGVGAEEQRFAREGVEPHRPDSIA